MKDCKLKISLKCGNKYALSATNVGAIQSLIDLKYIER